MDFFNGFGCGRVSQTAVIKEVPGGYKVVTFSIAVNRRVKSNGTWGDKAEFWEAEYWGVRAERAAPYLVSGKSITFTATMKKNTWENENGKHSRVILEITDLAFHGSVTGKATPQSQPEEPEAGPEEGADMPYSRPDGSDFPAEDEGNNGQMDIF